MSEIVEQRIGRVVSVTGAGVTGLVQPADGAPPPDIQLGALVKVKTPKSVVFGMVNQVRFVDPAHSSGASGATLVEIDLFGEGLPNGGPGGYTFRRGVSVYPTLGQQIATATRDDLAIVYARPTASIVRIGSIHQDSEIPAYVVTDDLLGKHFGIVGTTGSGKSCAVALILRAILEAHRQGHVLILDPHNEYKAAFKDLAAVFSPESLSLPYWLLNFEEAVSVLVSPDGVSRHAETNILKDAIVEAKRSLFEEDEDTSWITVDTPVPYPLSGLVRAIDNNMRKLDRPETSEPYQRLIARIESLRADRRFQFMFGSYSVRDNLADIIGQLMRIPVNGKPLSIVDLSGVPSEIVDVVVSLICRMVFDFAVWSKREDSVPILLACEEAHRYIPRDPNAGFTPTRRAISRIAMEGRKYGVSLCLITQRPTEISETILSQCNTLFSLRLTNDRDQEFLRRAMPDGAASLLSAVPALQTQEAIVVGDGVSVPMRIRFDDLSAANRPEGETAVFSEAWQDGEMTGDVIPISLERWRRQLRDTAPPE